MKYESIFGAQSLFDGAPEDAEYAGWFCQEVRWYMILNGKILFSDGGSWCTSDNPYLSADIAAMRRIIRTPTWRVADQKAGRLPEVLAKVDGGVVVFVNSFNVVTELESGAVIVSSPKTFLNTFKPIESPEEKSARLREEWCAKAAKTLKNLEYNSTLTSIYDALLSGDLPVPVKEQP